MTKKRIVAWTIAVVVLGAIAVGSLGAIPSGGQKPAQLPIPFSATTAYPIVERLDPTGLVPHDIGTTILMPVGYRVRALSDLNSQGTNFDRSASIVVSLAPTQVEAFFKAALPDAGWSIQSVTPFKGGAEVVASKAGSDGFYWEVGIKDPSGSATRGSILQMRLVQVSFS
ncbi:MAG: hypothetical protein ACYDHP_14440 [Ferrimicrobium sp.]